MGELLRLEVGGIAARAQYFDEAANRAANMQPVFEFGHEMFLEEERQQFLEQGGFFGEGWEPLNPEYARRKLALYGPPPSTLGILYRTERLHAALTNEFSDEHVREISPDSGVYGATVPYGKYHQTGGERLPQRKIIQVRARFARNMFRAAVAWITRGSVPKAEQ